MIADVRHAGDRGALPDAAAAVLIVHLRISLAEARRRATQRPVYLTDDEFELLHRQQPVDARLYDHVIEVDGLDLAAQVGEVRGSGGTER